MADAAHAIVDTERSSSLEGDLNRTASGAHARMQAAPSLKPVRKLYARGLLRLIAFGDGLIGLTLFASLFSTMYGLSLLDAPLREGLPFIIAGLAGGLAPSQFGVMRADRREAVLGHGARAAVASGAAALGCAALYWPFSDWATVTGLARGALALAVISGLLYMAYAALFRRWRAQGRFAQSAVLVGATPNAADLLERNKTIGDLQIVGLFDDRLERGPKELGGAPVLGRIDDLLSWDQLPMIDQIIITVPSKAHERVRQLVERLRGLPNRLSIILDSDGVTPRGAESLTQASGAAAIMLSGRRLDQRQLVVKRAQDLVFGAGILMAAAIPMAIIALLVKLDSPGPAIFRQTRHGFNNKPFTIYKFRSMKQETCVSDGDVRQVSAEDDRKTRIGEFLRETSLDELPQIFNVLRGDMSLVGPRPHAIGMKTGESYSHDLVADYAHRHRVKPGITGWAQVNGSRGPVSTPEDVKRRVRLDVEYIDRASLLFDIYIMLRTAGCLLGDKTNVR